MPPCWAVNLAVFYLEQLSEQCYGGRIHKKTVWFVHSEFPDFISLSQGIQKYENIRLTAHDGGAHIPYVTCLQQAVLHGQ